MILIKEATHIFFLRPFFPLVSLLFFPTAMMDRGSSRRGRLEPRSGANNFGRALTTENQFSGMADARGHSWCLQNRVKNALKPAIVA